MKKALQNIGNRRTELLLYFLLIALVAFGNGLSDSIYSNYFKEVYQVDSVQRGFIEFPASYRVLAPCWWPRSPFWGMCGCRSWPRSSPA